MSKTAVKPKARGTGMTPGRFKPGTIKRLLSYMGQYKVRLTVVTVCILITAGTSALSALFLQVLVDDHILPLLGQVNPSYAAMFRAILVMGAIYLGGALSAFISNRTMVTIEQGTLKKIRDDMFSHMQKLPVKYFDTHVHGDVMSRYTNDADSLRQAISQSIPQMFSSLISVIAAFVSMLYLSIVLSGFVILFTVGLMLTVRMLVSKSRIHFIGQQQALGDVNGYIEEIINGQKVVKVFCHEQKVKEAFDHKNDQLCSSATKAGIYGNITMPVIGSMGYLLYVLIAIVGGAGGIAGIPNLTIQGMGLLSMGTIISFLTLSRSFVNPIGQISMQFNMVIMALAGASRIFDLLDEPIESDSGYVTLVNARIHEDGSIEECTERTGFWAWKHPHKDGTITYAQQRGDIRFLDVNFGYVPGELVLKDISLYAKPGQKVAFVGATGAGKTTVTNLINRFYDVEDGKIRYDGITIKKIRKADLRRSLGMVLQDVNLFTGTVMDNIRYGKLDATDDECIEAARLANADSFIRMLPDGYQTMLKGDGSGLSQGQRQLISIARAAVANPPLMILDEATSSIDTRTESLVQKGMDALMKGRTVFVIAHRLSTVQDSNVIMVMDKGRIIERGTHEQLIDMKGKYWQLYTGALELE